MRLYLHLAMGFFYDTCMKTYNDGLSLEDLKHAFAGMGIEYNTENSAKAQAAIKAHPTEQIAGVIIRYTDLFDIENSKIKEHQSISDYGKKDHLIVKQTLCNLSIADLWSLLNAGKLDTEMWNKVNDEHNKRITQIFG